MKSIMDMFRPATTATPAPAPTPTPPGAIPASAGAALTPNNGVVPANGSDAPASSPGDSFKDLWKNDPNAVKPSNQIFENVTPEKLLEAAGKVDFRSVMTPEMMQRVAAGGEDGVRASMEAMNSMAQKTYAQSTFATTQIVEQAIGKAREQFNAQIPELIKRHNLNDGMRTENPALSNPAFDPVVKTIQRQFTEKFPQATASELRSMTSKYFDDLAAVAGAPKAKESAGSAGNQTNQTDWSKFLE